MPIFILPQHRPHPTDFHDWARRTPSQAPAHEYQLFAMGSWAGACYEGFGPETGDIIIKEHRGASSFADTDLDVRLRRHGITHIIFIGRLANTCFETSAGHAAGLGSYVTRVPDAMAAMSAEAMHAARQINGPSCAHAILTKVSDQSP